MERAVERSGPFIISPSLPPIPPSPSYPYRPRSSCSSSPLTLSSSLSLLLSLSRPYPYPHPDRTLSARAHAATLIWAGAPLSRSGGAAKACSRGGWGWAMEEDGGGRKGKARTERGKEKGEEGGGKVKETPLALARQQCAALPRLALRQQGRLAPPNKRRPGARGQHGRRISSRLALRRSVSSERLSSRSHIYVDSGAGVPCTCR